MVNFKVGDVVQVGTMGEKGKIIDIYRPRGSYCMYKVHIMSSGEVRTAARHELVKGLPDEIFQNVFNYPAKDLDSASIINLEKTVAHPPPKKHSNASSSRSVPATSTSQSTFNVGPHEQNEHVSTSSSKPVPVSTGSKRFARMDITPELYRDSMKNASTERKTTCHMKGGAKCPNPRCIPAMQLTRLCRVNRIAVLLDFLHQKGENRQPHSIPPTELDQYLQEFIICVRQHNGTEYEPSSLRGMISSFDRYLRDKNYGTAIAKGPEFSGTMATLASKSKDLKKQGKGNKPHQAAPLTDEEIDMLYETGQLGCQTPQSLINTLWLNNTLHFGMRGGPTEHRQLQWGDVQMGFDYVQNKEYLQFLERQTKTRTGIDINNIRAENPRMYATSNDRCPVAAYKKYADKRPDGFSAPHHPFYLATVTHTATPSDAQQWFLRGPIGKNKLASLVKCMADKAGLPELANGKRLTNTSARKTLCQKLLTNNVPDTQAVHITGHKNTSSLNNYRQLTNQQQMYISNIISNNPTSSRQGSSSTTIISQQQSDAHVASSSEISPDSVGDRFYGLFANATITGGSFNLYFGSN